MVLGDTLEDEARDKLVKTSQPNRPKVTKEPSQMLSLPTHPTICTSFFFKSCKHLWVKLSGDAARNSSIAFNELSTMTGCPNNDTEWMSPYLDSALSYLKVLLIATFQLVTEMWVFYIICTCWPSQSELHRGKSQAGRNWFMVRLYYEDS